jgi:zinc transport system substrate-binding protein
VENLMTNRKSYLALVATAGVALSLIGCAAEPAGTATAVAGDAGDERLVVYVVNYPLMYFAERIGGEHVEVVFPAPADGDPAFWQPDVETITAYQSADLIVRNGAAYAKWIDMASLPDSKMVYSSAAFFEDVIVEEGGVSHAHGPEGEHSHGETAFTTWLDPLQAIAQAEAIAAAMAADVPAAAPEIDANMVSLRDDLHALDARLQAATAAMGAVPVLASHPVYQYLARRYDLALRTVLFEPEEVPTPEDWALLEQLHEEHPAVVMLWEAEPLPQTRQRLQAMGIKVLVFDPAGNRPQVGDYLDVMRTNAENLERYVQ